jgi:hypothetical protein
MSRIDFAANRKAGEAYQRRWQEMRAQGVKPFILSRSLHPEQWRAWRAYYRAHGLWASLDLMEDGSPEKSVPCLDPADFERQVFIEVVDRRVKDD